MQKLKNSPLIKKCLAHPSMIILVGILISFTVFRLVLSAKAPYFINLYAGYDDQLFVHYSEELLKGNWLGDYSTKTLSKGISYSLFIVWAHKLHISYGMLLGLLNVLASSVSAVAMRPLIKKRWLLCFLYLFFLYSPVTLTSEYSTRIYRNTLVVPAVFLVIGCLVGLYFRRKGSLKSFALWSVGLSLIFPFYWYVREDSLWLLPLVLVGVGIIAGSIFFTNQYEFHLKNLPMSIKKITVTKQQVVKLSLCLLPFILLFSTTTVLKNTNQERYGISSVNDRTGGAFGKVSKQLIRLDDGTDLNETNATIWVSKKALKKAETVSPTLKSISKNIDWIYHGSPWTDGSEIAGDIIFWALRDAADQAGYYKDGQKTEEFWQTVDSELSAAYKKDTLKKKKELYLTATGDGKRIKDLPVVASFMKSGFDYNVFYKDYAQGSDVTLGPKKDVSATEKLLKHSFSNNWQDVNAEAQPVKLTRIAKLSNLIIGLYRKLLPIWLVICSLGFLAILSGSIFAKKQLEIYRGLLLIIIGLLLSYLIFLIGVSWFCSWAPERKDLFMMTYTGSGVAVVQWIEALSFAGITQLVPFSKKNIK